jgi:hypothetical protein
MASIVDEHEAEIAFFGVIPHFSITHIPVQAFSILEDNNTESVFRGIEKEYTYLESLVAIPRHIPNHVFGSNVITDQVVLATKQQDLDFLQYSREKLYKRRLGYVSCRPDDFRFYQISR